MEGFSLMLPPVRKCECGSTEVVVTPEAEMVCASCGIVCMSGLHPQGPDWGVEGNVRADPFEASLGTRNAAASGSDFANWSLDQTELRRNREHKAISQMCAASQLDDAVGDQAFALWKQFLDATVSVVKGSNRQAMFAVCIYLSARSNGVGLDNAKFLQDHNISPRSFSLQLKNLSMNAKIQVVPKVDAVQNLSSQAFRGLHGLGLSNVHMAAVQEVVAQLAAKVPNFRALKLSVVVAISVILASSVQCTIPKQNITAVCKKLGVQRDGIMKKAKAMAELM